MINVGAQNISTSPCLHQSWKQTGSYSQILGYCFVVIPLGTLVLNFAEIVFVVTAPKLKAHTRIFLISLAVCDILNGLIVMPFKIFGLIGDDVLVFGHTGCDVVNILDLMLLATSSLHLCALAVNRCVASVRPFQIGYWFGLKYGSLVFATCWVLPAILTVGFIFPKFHILGLGLNCRLEIPGSCRLLANVHYSILFTVFAFVIPAVIILASVRCIINAVNRREQMFLKLSNLHTKRGRFHRRYFGTTLSRTILTMTSYSLIFLLPFFTVFVVDPFLTYKVPKYVWIAVTWFRHSHSLINPVLYMKGTKSLTFRRLNVS